MWQRLDDVEKETYLNPICTDFNWQIAQLVKMNML
jgi:hypothetical protein